MDKFSGTLADFFEEHFVSYANQGYSGTVTLNNGSSDMTLGMPQMMIIYAYRQLSPEGNYVDKQNLINKIYDIFDGNARFIEDNLDSLNLLEGRRSQNFDQAKNIEYKLNDLNLYNLGITDIRLII
ncbi:MAG: hypothetical protein NDI94_05030 [Candidatus Woesearchaeota archaeon]|nr:hypothetical protein [Candidatus Woesearchaeota archaeon]